MRKLRLKSIFELSHNYENYNFVNCSFDYRGIPNILLARGIHEHLDEDGFPVLLFKNELDYLLVILSDETEVYELREVYDYFDFAFKANEDKYLFACSNFSDEEGLDYGNNCKIYNKEKRLINEFCVGSYFNDIQITNNGKIWVAEEDIAIFGNWEPAEAGLCCFDLEGNILYKFNSKDDSIYDCYAINATDKNVWLYYYDKFYFVQLIDNNVEMRIKSPIAGIEHFALSCDNEKTILVDNGYNNHETFTLCKLDNNLEKLGDYQFVDEKDELLKCCHSQGKSLIFWSSNNLYFTSMDYVNSEHWYMGDKELNKFENDIDNRLLNAFLTTVINKEEIEKLISSGANINAIDKYDDSILTEVLSYHDHIGINLENIQYIIDLGADVKYKIEGFDALYNACLTADMELVELLIKNGADVNCVSTDVPESLLNWAEFDSAEYNNELTKNKMEEVVQTLKKHGAMRLSDIEKKNSKKWAKGI